MKRIGAWLAVFVAAALVVIWAIVTFYAVRSHRPPLGPYDAVSLLTVALLVFGAVRELRGGDSRYLILAWAWLAGAHLPDLFVVHVEPAYVLNAKAGPDRALLYEAWQYGLSVQFFWAAAYSVVAIAGLLLCLWPARLERGVSG